MNELISCQLKVYYLNIQGTLYEKLIVEEK